MSEYVVVRSGDGLVIPNLCPECGAVLVHCNAVDTGCRLYMVWCRDWRCRWCEVYWFK